MKRRNFNKSILQQGGLMIEALAMLGLIAVVTPTMYKKSAERTMEVEDINTAATIRTITAAANDYVSANYSTILGDMVKNGEHERKLDPKDLGAYLPYGFEIDKALYNYDGEHIQLSVSRPEGSNNLTTLMLFPAKLDEENGIGQERTSRIAALIGSSGGYVTDSNKARGIGGIWELSGDHYTKNFSSANKYSIVTVSADTISASAGNEMDYSKYLQRGKDPDDTGGQWKNTMRTDLYMGGPQLSSEDVYHEATGPHSIRNINSLIVGANTSGGVDGEGNDLADAGGYGLYVAPGAANPNAYIHGSLEAGNGQLNADENNLKYGTGTDDDGNSWVGFNVDKEGTISNLKDLNLAKKAGNWTSILIGALENDGDDKNYIIKAQPRDGESLGKVSLLGDDIVSLSGYAPKDNYMPYPNRRKASSDRVVILNNGWKTDENLQPIDEPQYNSEPSFPMRVGANAKYQGILAAGQLDTQKIRAASLSVGSQNIDDSEKWLNVDTYGITIKDVDRHYDGEDYVSTGTYGSFTNNGILLRVSDDKGDTNGITDEDRGTLGTPGGRDTSTHGIQFNLRNSKKFAGGKALSNVAELFADNTDIRGKETARISGNGTIIQATNMEDWEYDYKDGWEDETKDFRDEPRGNTVLLRNTNMQMHMEDSDLIISGRTVSTDDFTLKDPEEAKEISTIFNGGTVDVKNADFNVFKDYTNRGPWASNTSQQVFSVRTNSDGSGPQNTYSQYDTNGKQIGYDITMHGNILITNEEGGKLAAGNGDANQTVNYVNVGDNIYDKAGINIIDNEPKPKPTTDNSNPEHVQVGDAYKKILTIEQGATDTSNHNSNSNYVDPGTVYIRKGYVEVHGDDSVFTDEKDKSKKTEANKGNGVIVASRLVANNPTSGAYGATVPQLVTTTELQNYETKGASVQRYDTYMVNPAYTSVMHDIKLTTRGGARLSDILPDFINKGIYVVNNTFLEVENDNLDYKKWPTTYNKDKIEIDNKTYTALGKSIDFGKTWASPFMGVVPAPQCPPGYGRVITLTPASFETGISGSLQTDDKGQYYVLPERVQDEQYALTVRGQRPKYETVAIESASGSMNISINNSALNLSNAQTNVSELSGISTAKYVLSSNELRKSDGETIVDPITPLTVQQSTWLKSGVQKLTSDGTDTGYVQGWATTMGFLYKNALYMPLLDSGADSKKFSWNIFPVMPYTLEGYATVYCYFDRTNLYMGRGEKKYNTGGGNVDTNYESYIDKLNYMSNPSGSTMPSSAKKTDSNYTKRLNDPNMKYDEVW